MEDNNSEDVEMVNDFKGKLDNGPSCSSVLYNEEQDLIRPMTPPNNASVASPKFFSTPLSFEESDDEPFTIKRIGIDRNFMRHRFTSPSMNKLSKTMPAFSSHPPLSGNIGHCKSADSIRVDKFGPDRIPFEYINPFTPDGKLITSKTKAQKQLKMLSINNTTLRKIDLSDSMDSEAQSTGDDSEVDLPARPRLTDFNVSRFNEEFVEMKEIGQGVHGCVYKCLNRINGCIYAIKRTIKPIKSSIQERIIRNEIYAHGVLDHPNIVRNFSCWKEEGFVFIQNEFCNGGCLEDYIQANIMNESSLRSLLLQMAHALRYMHKKGLAHLDVKPGNIFLSIDKSNKDGSVESDGGYSDDDKFEEIIYKLGDLGHVTKLDEEQDVEEGDCRYLPREILEERFTNLDRADVFALGLTVYEAAGGGPLPKNGDEWQDLRNGKLVMLDHLSKEFQTILKDMIQPEPDKRPSATELIKLVKPTAPSALPEDVFSYLHQYHHTNARLEHKVETSDHIMRALLKSQKQLQELVTSKAGTTPTKTSKKKGAISKSRVVGKKTKRSSSTTTF